ncbi:MAG: tetratricopeptide repeat protein [Succinivibrio sp.]
MLIHAVTALFYAFTAHKHLPQHLVLTTPRTVCLFFVIVLFVPIAGVIGTSIAIVYALHHPLNSIKVTWKENIRESLPANPGNLDYTKFGTGALRDILLNSPSVDKRTEVITSVSRLPRNERISFYKTALRDPVDEVRLLAYSQLDPIEQELTDCIKNFESEFKKHPQSDLAFDIAQQFWELCYLGISDGVVMEHYIKQAGEWCDTAISLNPHPRYYLLRGRIHLQLGNVDRSYECLSKALESKMLESQVIPYMAECAYRKHDYKKVRELVKKINYTEGSRLAMIKEYWGETV